MEIKDYIGNREKITLSKKIRILSVGSVVGKKESEGPLASYFDECNIDTLLSEKSFERAESLMCKRALEYALDKCGLRDVSLDFILAGDLMNQCTGCGYGLESFDAPYIGLYGACSTFAEAILIGSMMIETGKAKVCACVASSHFCSAERQFRFPLSYGSFGSSTAQSTVTGAGAVILCDDDCFNSDEKGIYVKELVPGIVVDRGIKDAANMGAAMCGAAADTVKRYTNNSEKEISDIDLVVTGDLGWAGTKMLSDLLRDESVELYESLRNKLCDCGLMIYDIKKQDVGLGGSGCGCSAVTFCGYLYSMLSARNLNKIALIGTGAMMSPKSVEQGESIPGIAHLVTIEASN